MTENMVRDQLREVFGEAAYERVRRFIACLIAENARQNLVSASTLASVWFRHVLDSAQLLRFADDKSGAWLDVGSGAGFPGAIVALLTDREVWLVEPRTQRADFLAATLTGRPNAQVCRAHVERLNAVPAAIISARAVAATPRIFALTRHLATLNTRYILPKGRNAMAELESVRREWHGMFHVEPSVTSAESGIIIADRVESR